MKKYSYILPLFLLSGFGIKQLEAVSVVDNIVQEVKYENIEIESSLNDKIFIREYTYRSSEDDSKNSSRKKAIQQLKVILSEEVGTHIESYLKINKGVQNGVPYKSINSEIKSLSASITKLEIISEKWDGKNYWVKASVQINEARTSELLLSAIKSKSNDKDVERLNKILDEQKKQLNSKNWEMVNLNKKLVAQEIINEARKNEVVQIKTDLVKYQAEEIKQKEEEIKFSSELKRKKALIQKLNRETSGKVNLMKREWLDTKEVLCSFDIGTSFDKIEEISGKKLINSYYSSYYETRKSGIFHFYGAYSNDMEHSNYKFRICPDHLLQSELEFNCIYFAFENKLLASRGGCNSKVYQKTK